MKFNRIIMHHTGGAYKANDKDLSSYHTVTQGDGTTVRNRNGYDANAIGRKLVAGEYAAHTLNLNSGSIGKAIAAMGGGDWRYPYECDYFPRAAQMDMFLIDVAKDAKFYGISVTRETILSHAEVEITLGVKQRNKWDFDYDPYRLLMTRDPVKIGDALRDRIRRLMVTQDDIRTAPNRTASTSYNTTIKQGVTGILAAELQTALSASGYPVKVDSIFGPATRKAVIRFQKDHQLVPDGIVGPLTWTMLYA